MLLAAGLLLLLEVPGRRTSFTSYAHGWPLSVVDRDYARDPRLFTPEGLPLGARPGLPMENEQSRQQQVEEWSINGFPWSLESQMTPWSLENATKPRIVAGVVDLAVVVLLLVAFYRYQQRRRRGRLPQFSLRALLIAVGICGLASNWVSNLIRERAAEKEAIDELAAHAGFHCWQYASSPVRVMGAKVELEGWNPPFWLPESVLKIGGVAEMFHRVSSVHLVGEEIITDATLQHLASFGELRHLEIESTKVTENGLAQLSALRHLADLKIVGLKITDAGASHIAKIAGLKRLELWETEITDAGLDRLARLSSLDELNLRSAKITAAGIGSLTRLKSLTLRDCGVTRLELRDFSVLESLDFSADDVSVDLNNLPALDSLAIHNTAKGKKRVVSLRLAGVPKLRIAVLEGLSFAETGWQQIRESPRLEAIGLYGVTFSQTIQSWVNWPPTLRYLYISGTGLTTISVEEMPCLESLETNGNSELAKLTLRNLPALSTVDLQDSEKLTDLRLGGLDNLREFRVDMGAPRAHFTGLSRMRSLETLTIARTVVDPSTIAAAGTLPKLKSLDLFWAELADEDLKHLAVLTQLTSLNLRVNHLSDSAVDALRRQLPNTKIGF